MTTATEVLNKVAVVGKVAFDPHKFKKGGALKLDVANPNSEYTTRIAIKTFSSDVYEKFFAEVHKGDTIKVTGTLSSQIKNQEGGYYDHPDNWIQPRTVEILDRAEVSSDIAPDTADLTLTADDDDDIPFRHMQDVVTFAGDSGRAINFRF